MSLPAAVLWDMDGTLVDTEPYWIAAEHAIVAEHGGTWSDEFAHQLVGNDLMVSAAFIRDHSPIDWSPERIVDELLVRVVAQVREHVPWRPGARELLDALRAEGVPSALVTMSWRSLADAVVSALPEGAFAVVVTGDEVRTASRTPSPTAPRPASSASSPRTAWPSRTRRPGCARRWPRGCRPWPCRTWCRCPRPPGAVHVDGPAPG